MCRQWQKNVVLFLDNILKTPIFQLFNFFHVEWKHFKLLWQVEMEKPYLSCGLFSFSTLWIGNVFCIMLVLFFVFVSFLSHCCIALVPWIVIESITTSAKDLCCRTPPHRHTHTHTQAMAANKACRGFKMLFFSALLFSCEAEAVLPVWLALWPYCMMAILKNFRSTMMHLRSADSLSFWLIDISASKPH